MKAVSRTVMLMSAVILLSPAAYAAGQSDPRASCRQDAQTFCKGVQPGGGRIKDCLEDHYKEISDDCYAALKNAPAGPPPQQQGQSQQFPGTHDGPPPPDDGAPPSN